MKNFILGILVGGVRGNDDDNDVEENFILLSTEVNDRRFVNIPKHPNVRAIKPKKYPNFIVFDGRGFDPFFLFDLDGDDDDNSCRNTASFPPLCCCNSCCRSCEST